MEENIPHMNHPVDDDYLEMLDRTRGMWADIADEIEFYIRDSREKIALAEKEKWEYLFSVYDEVDE